jgi:hypothetical protein
MQQAFPRAGKTAREPREAGRNRVPEWAMHKGRRCLIHVHAGKMTVPTGPGVGIEDVAGLRAGAREL